MHPASSINQKKQNIMGRDQGEIVSRFTSLTSPEPSGKSDMTWELAKSGGNRRHD
ncbi:hypothetical protein Plim_0906 [Planctopirus limnophila DSM 3776]|uniref:Uncharacterized protein n=1 Tax=Planctopirus limnophila (strain ATCC 43296 / DSM 3776 / IFAM 1008 / Mu 290) TaxID=521674 RepID=D5SSK2_PLAL2|nr:hypothetical protein Plim_0906 [Planctopirus limnophila DSM 3776]